MWASYFRLCIIFFKIMITLFKTHVGLVIDLPFSHLNKIHKYQLRLHFLLYCNQFWNVVMTLDKSIFCVFYEAYQISLVVWQHNHAGGISIKHVLIFFFFFLSNQACVYQALIFNICFVCVF